MSHEQHNPHNQFAAWGKAAQKLPARNLELKNVALFTLKPVEKNSRTKKMWWRYLAPAMGVLAALQLITVISLPFESSTSLFDAGAARQEKSIAPTAPVAVMGRESSDTFGLNPLNSELSGTLGDSDLRTKVAELVAPFSSLAMVADYVEQKFEKKVSDTREFLKTYYQAAIRTRQVAKLATHIQTMARGYGGRVDDISVNQKNAHISFVIPKAKFEAFTDELRGLVKPKFIEEFISSENLLAQKQGIEKQTKVADDAIISIQKKRQELIDNHTAVVKSIQQRINNFSYQLSNLRTQLAATTDSERQVILSQQITRTISVINQTRAELRNENNRFDGALKNNDAELVYAQQRVDDVKEADKDLLANVETVEASVSLQWISLWEVIELYVPIYWIIGGLLIATTIGYFTFVRRHVFKLP